jgi:hypothetical protein
MLPAEITTMTGSDYDIDKMYLMIPEFRTDGKTISKIEYHTEATREAYSAYIKENSNDAALVKGLKK